MKLGMLMTVFVVTIVAVVAGIWGVVAMKTVETVDELFHENKKLEQALTQLSSESLIGYVRVRHQERIEGTVYTTLQFVQTHRDETSLPVMEKEYVIEGDIVHFDALIVSFDPDLVQDGQRRSLYLWRRVYGENQAPARGFAIEEPGGEPYRYRELLNQLPVNEQTLFWDAIWSLANDPDRLESHGIRAAFGNAVYMQLQPGKTYKFTISNSGQFTPEVVEAI